MSDERVERIREILPPDGTDLVEIFGPDRSFSAGGLASDDAVVRFVARDAEMGGTGPDAFYDRWADWLEAWETYRLYTDDVVDRGDRVVALVRLRGVTKHGGVEMEHEAATVYRFEGDQVVEIVFTMDREDALRA